MEKYVYIKDMREISEYGGSYEDTCRVMLKTGLEYLDKNPNSKPEFYGHKNVYGLIVEDNNDAKVLSEIVIEASGGDCTGAMLHAVISHILFIKENGWNKYVEQMKNM